jgi:hypothetical protein
MAKTKTRHAATSIRIDPNVRCMRVYPVEGTRKTVDELQTVGMKLSKEQAVHLARVLLAVTQEWNEVELTAKRFEQRKRDGTFPLTVTKRAAD